MSDGQKLYIHQWAYDFLQRKVSGITFYGWSESYPDKPIEGLTRITWEDGVPMKAENWDWKVKGWVRDDEYIYRIVSGGGPGTDDWVGLEPGLVELLIENKL